MPAGNTLSEGSYAPDFALKDTHGRTVKLSELRGKKIILYFYPNDFTSGCTTEACEFRDENPEIKKKGALVFGVSANDEKSHQEFSAKYNLNFPLLVDEGAYVAQKYGVWGEKNNYGKTSMGMLRTTFVIDEKGKIVKVFRNVKAEGHAKEVLRALV